MTARRNAGNAGIVGAGVAACGVCCAPLIGGFLAAIGLGTVVGIALFGVIGMLIALLAIPVIVRRRRATSGTARAPSEETAHAAVSRGSRFLFFAEGATGGGQV